MTTQRTPDHTFERAFQVLATLPKSIRFGTSSWTYAGWQGSIYRRPYRSKAEFSREALTEYWQFPLFRTVGIDSFFYAPPTASTLARYQSQTPREAKWVTKVWEQISTPKFPTHPRYGAQRGQINENFLSVDLFLKHVLPPFRTPGVWERTGPFVLQLPYIDHKWLSNAELLEQLQRFLSKLPDDVRVAVEFRNQELLAPGTFQLLNDCRATLCFNHWGGMPPLREQMQRAAAAGGILAPVFVARLLTPLGVNYENAVRRFTPYDSIKEPNLVMRRDMVALLTRVLKRDGELFCLVNNRCEGFAPGTIAAVLELYDRKTTQPTHADLDAASGSRLR